MSPDSQDKPLDAVVAAVQLPDVSDGDFESSLAELRELAKTLGYRVVQTFTQKRANFDTTAYLGTGKREEVREFVESQAGAARDERPGHATTPELEGIQVLLIDHEISPSQAQPGEGRGMRGDGPHHGDPGDLPPPRALARRACAGGDRAPGLHGAAPA